MSVRAIAALSEWTRQQGGMVTTAQATTVGVDRITLHALTRARVLSRIRHGVYKLVGAPWSRNDEIRAAWLQAESGPVPPEQRQAAVCRQTAAMVYGYGDLVPPSIQIAVPGTRRTNQPDLRYYRDYPPPPDVEWVDDIRVTLPRRIIANLLADGYSDLEHLAAIAVDAINAGNLTGYDLAHACEPYASRYGLPDGATLAGVMWQSYTGMELQLT